MEHRLQRQRHRQLPDGRLAEQLAPGLELHRLYQQLTQAWSGVCSQSGAHVSCANAAWNGAVGPGGSVTLGFNGTWSGGNPAPAVALS